MSPCEGDSASTNSRIASNKDTGALKESLGSVGKKQVLTHVQLQCFKHFSYPLGKGEAAVVATFYCDVLGFHVLDEQPNVSFDRIRLQHPVGLIIQFGEDHPDAHFVATPSSGWSPECKPKVERAPRLAFQVGDVVATEVALASRGISYSRFQSSCRNAIQLFFSDPAGNGIEIYSCRDGSSPTPLSASLTLGNAQEHPSVVASPMRSSSGRAPQSDLDARERQDTKATSESNVPSDTPLSKGENRLGKGKGPPLPPGKSKGKSPLCHNVGACPVGLDSEQTPNIANETQSELRDKSKAPSEPLTDKSKGRGKGPPPPPNKGKGKNTLCHAPGKASTHKGSDVSAKSQNVEPICGAESSGQCANIRKTGPKMRPVFWATASEAQVNSVWTSRTAPADFDHELVERCFTLQVTKGDDRMRMKRCAEEAGGPRKRLRVLSDNCSKQLAIQFKRLPPPERLLVTLNTLEGFPDNIADEALVALRTTSSKHCEDVEKIRRLQLAEADLDKLDIPERYLWVLGCVDFCSAKLACGALIVGQAQELRELRTQGEVLQTACRALRESHLLKKCIFTCLATGNFVNRGTPREAARALVLPDALLKVDECQSVRSGHGPVNTLESRTVFSLLDVVAEAVAHDMQERENADARGLSFSVEELYRKVSAAACVCIEELELRCHQIQGEAKKVIEDLQMIAPLTQQVIQMKTRVSEIVHESNTICVLVAETKEEVFKIKQWSSRSTAFKTAELLTEWCQFLERFSKSLGRANLGKSKSPQGDLSTTRAFRAQCARIPECIGIAPDAPLTNVPIQNCKVSTVKAHDVGSVLPLFEGSSSERAPSGESSLPTAAISNAGIAFESRNATSSGLVDRIASNGIWSVSMNITKRRGSR